MVGRPIVLNDGMPLRFDGQRNRPSASMGWHCLQTIKRRQPDARRWNSGVWRGEEDHNHMVRRHGPDVGDVKCDVDIGARGNHRR